MKSFNLTTLATTATLALCAATFVPQNLYLSGSRGKLLLNLALVADLREFTVELRSDQQCKTRPVEPRHQGDHCAQRSVRLVEVSKVSEIEAEQIRERNPAAHSKNGARHCCSQALLHVRREEV